MGNAHIHPDHLKLQVLAPWKYLLRKNCREGTLELKAVALCDGRLSVIETRK